jgi:uncharacterized protein (DUF2147 family)
MRYRTVALNCAVAVVGCAASNAALAASDAKGVWLNDTGRGAIEIKDCGDKLCGHVVWTRDEGDASRGCGKQIIGDAAAQGGGLWDGGWIYSPDKKRRYDVELKPLSDGTLRVKGYAGTKFFSKTMIWTPAPADLKRCDANNVEAKAAPQAAPETTASIAKQEPAAPVAATKPPVVQPPVEAKALPPATSATQALAATEAAKANEPAPRAPESKSEPKLEPNKDAAANAPAKKPEPRVAQADDEGGDTPNNLGDLVDKLDGQEFGDGYGLKKMGNGDCRVKLPYVNITVPCKK